MALPYPAAQAAGGLAAEISEPFATAAETDSEARSADEYKGFDEHTRMQVRDLARTFTQESDRASMFSKPAQVSSNAGTAGAEGINPISDNDPNLEGYSEELDPNSDMFNSVKWVQNMANTTNSDPDYYKPYSLGCCWQNLSAAGESADVAYQTTIANLPEKIIKYGIRHMRPKRSSDTFQILKPMDGCLKPGELMVVLGRPGSGCTTFLKSISTNTHGFNLSPETEISYSGLTPKEIRQHYRGEVVYNAEADIHLPHLTVYQTLFTVAKLKTPRNRIKGVDRESFARHLTEVAMATYGLSHTRNTKVGNDLVRGVSGGERKRVSIAEVSICGSKLQCWDNATRGLDSATALEFIRALKTQASIMNSAAAVAIYQCSQDAYDLFDKVCVLYEGYQIYFGSSRRAKAYFEEMGYVCPSRQTTADFLTAVTSPSERILNREMIDKGVNIPQNPKDMYQYWLESSDYKSLKVEIDEQLNHDNEEAKLAIKDAHAAKQSKRARPSSPYTVSYALQVKYLLKRNFWRIRNNMGITLFMIIGNSSMAFIFGSMFYKIMRKPGTSTFYSRGAAMFFAVLFNAFSSLLEIFSLYEARPITEKHRTYSLYHPSADAFASVLSEVPTKLITAVCFNIVFYFLVKFRLNGGVFFFYFLINITGVFAMSHLFRCVGSLTKTLAEAMVPASMLLLALSMYTGFAIPKKNLLGWSKWIWYINPLAYLFESLMVNEFHDVHFSCNSYVPSGSAYNNVAPNQRICSAVGAVAGQDYVLGDSFLRESYGYEHKHKWRGFGIGLAYVIFFLVIYLFLCEVNEGAKQKGEILVYPRNIMNKMKRNKIKKSQGGGDIESNSPSDSSISEKKIIQEATEEISSSDIDRTGLSKSQAIFHWRDLRYEVNVKGETKHILNGVDGWVKPGTLTALMGASGAGKTTLLDCLAERTTMGVITGDVLVNGRPRDTSFPRSIGYCQQQDLHLKTATVRESLRFSACLRQPASVPVEEKYKYVEEVIKILEMEKYADAVVGVAGEGLNVEQRKRLTIGVELTAKPKLLVFLDEPTSGLDSQTAWSICQLMRKLANHGQAILCTIHQPSAILMQEFDRLLFLQRGGKTAYFGELGEGCKTMIDYFESHGAHKCPPDANPAEWMLEVVGAAPGSHANQDYHEVWLKSDEYKAVIDELDWMATELPKRHETEILDHSEFATPISYQCKLVSIRLFQQYWRTPGYLWPKFFLTVFNELFIGFTFFKANLTQQGLQNQMLSLFMFTVIFNPLLQQYLPTFVQQRDLYEARERPSRTFSWKAFIFSQIFVEIPWNLLAGTIAYFIYYYPVAFYRNASAADQLHERGALFWLFSMAYFVYIGSTGFFVISFSEVAEGAANLASLLFTMSLSFCGVMTTPQQMPRFWIFMYRVSPLTYLIEALLSIGLANVNITCSDVELLKFNPPSNMTCGEYLQPYFNSAKTGYLSDPESSTICSLCTVSKSNDYLSSINVYYSHRWRNYGIFIGYIAFNYAAGVFLYWLSRVPKKPFWKKS